MAVQMDLILQGLNASEEALLTGFMKYLPPASQVVSLRGQHWQDAPEQGHVCELQSCIAPVFRMG